MLLSSRKMTRKMFLMPIDVRAFDFQFLLADVEAAFKRPPNAVRTSLSIKLHIDLLRLNVCDTTRYCTRFPQFRCNISFGLNIYKDVISLLFAFIDFDVFANTSSSLRTYHSPIRSDARMVVRSFARGLSERQQQPSSRAREGRI